MRTAILSALFVITFSAVSSAEEQSTYVCKATNWVQISPEGNLLNMERPEASMFSFIVENSQVNFVSDAITENTLNLVYTSPAPEFRAEIGIGVQGIETLYYRKGLFSFIKQTPKATEVVHANCDEI